MSEELTPMNHRELWLQAIATGTVPEWLEPMTHEELWLKTIAQGGGGGGLPTVSASDNGKYLKVVNGAWAVASLPNIYTVTVSLTNPRNSGLFSGCVIKSCSSEYDADGTEIGTITSATGSTTVNVTTERIYVEIKGGSTAGGNVTTTGNIEGYGNAEYPIVEWFVISGNGTITFDNVNYDD